VARQFSAVGHLLWSGPASSDKRGRDAKVIHWLDELTAECPKQIVRNTNDPCGAKCPQLPKVL
jgi:hypothetical protein